MTAGYTPTDRSTATRMRERMTYDRDAAHAILDEAYDCSVGLVVDGAPRVLPTLHARVDDTLYLHGSSGGRFGLAARRDEVAICVSVTLLDGIVYARSQFHHSANYRSVVAHGTAHLVTDPQEKARAMAALVDKVGPGRAQESRPPTRQELAATSVLALPLTEVSVRSRAHGVAEDPDDLTLPHWAGLLPVRREFGPPEPAPDVAGAPPAYLPRATHPWVTPVPLSGRHVRLEPLTPGHVPDLMRSLADDEVWQHLSAPRPRTPEEMDALVQRHLRAQWQGSMAAWAQVDTQDGHAIGITTFYDIDADRRSLGIGHTIVGRPWWRTGVNTEAKLLLLRHAFDTLGAERVHWHTDIRNERSQRAIARLGAEREGVLRRHRRRPDGSWRDTVMFAMTIEDWPAAAQQLQERLAAGDTAARTAR